MFLEKNGKAVRNIEELSLLDELQDKTLDDVKSNVDESITSKFNIGKDVIEFSCGMVISSWELLNSINLEFVENEAYTITKIRDISNQYYITDTGNVYNENGYHMSENMMILPFTSEEESKIEGFKSTLKIKDKFNSMLSKLSIRDLQKIEAILDKYNTAMSIFKHLGNQGDTINKALFDDIDESNIVDYWKSTLEVPNIEKLKASLPVVFEDDTYLNEKTFINCLPAYLKNKPEPEVEETEEMKAVSLELENVLEKMQNIFSERKHKIKTNNVDTDAYRKLIESAKNLNKKRIELIEQYNLLTLKSESEIENAVTKKAKPKKETKDNKPDTKKKPKKK